MLLSFRRENYISGWIHRHNQLRFHVYLGYWSQGREGFKFRANEEQGKSALISIAAASLLT